MIRGVQTSTAGQFGDEDPPPFVFDITELGDPVPISQVQKDSKIDFEEELDLRIDYFDVAGKVLASKDLLKVKKLRSNDFLPFKQPGHAAVTIRKMPSESIVYAVTF